MNMQTIEDSWSAANGKPFGFDYLRVGLAVAIILWHTILVCYGRYTETFFWVGPLRPLIFFLVPSFFSLSGFLVAGSLLRNNLISFTSLRLIRIYPALTFEVLLSAFVIGALFTEMSLIDYFSNELFYKYLLNITGYIHYFLPGVFTDLPGGAYINLQLWTVPYELECYVLLILLSLIGTHKHPVRFFIISIFLNLTIILYCIFASQLPEINERPPGKMIVLCFLFGVCFFLLKEKIRISFPLFLLSILCYLILIYLRVGIYIAPVFITYATVYLGLSNTKFPVIGLMSNYSYGIYLYGFPIQQVISKIFPNYRHWWFNFILSTVLSLLAAAISWHLLEKKVADRKKVILGWVNKANAKL